MKPTILSIAKSMAAFVADKENNEVDRITMRDCLTTFLQTFENDIFKCASCEELGEIQDCYRLEDDNEDYCRECRDRVRADIKEMAADRDEHAVPTFLNSSTMWGK